MLTNRTLIKLMEDFANQAHESWSGWMKHLFTKGKVNEDGSFTIDKASVQRWCRQMDTPYNSLSEDEKNSDRIEAEKYLEILFASGVCFEKHADDYAKVKGFWREKDDK